jgi:hypothetical protein
METTQREYGKFLFFKDKNKIIEKKMTTRIRLDGDIEELTQSDIQALVSAVNDRKLDENGVAQVNEIDYMKKLAKTLKERGKGEYVMRADIIDEHGKHQGTALVKVAEEDDNRNVYVWATKKKLTERQRDRKIRNMDDELDLPLLSDLGRLFFDQAIYIKT